MNSWVKFALGLAGMPAGMVDDLDKAMPGSARLIDAAKQIAPILSQAQPDIEAITPHLTAMMPHLQALLPLFDKAMPIMKAAYPDLVAVLPTAKEIVAFVGEKKAAAAAPPVDPSRSPIG
jgi:hypothetical protein